MRWAICDRRYQFWIGPGRVRVGVLGERAADREGQAGGRDQLGLQDRVVVAFLPADGLFLAVWAVPLAEGQLARAVDDDQRVSEQPPIVQDLHAQQTLDHLSPQAVVGPAGHVPEKVLQRGGVRQGRVPLATQAVEVFQGLGAVQLEPHLPAGTQLQDEDQQPHPGQELPGIEDAVLGAGIRHLAQPRAELGPEVPDGPAQGGPER